MKSCWGKLGLGAPSCKLKRLEEEGLVVLGRSSKELSRRFFFQHSQKKGIPTTLAQVVSLTDHMDF